MVKRVIFLLISFFCSCNIPIYASNVNFHSFQASEIAISSTQNILTIVLQGYNQLDLLKQLEDYNLLIRILYFFNLILFLVAIIIILIYIRSRLKGKKFLVEKNEQINFYNKQLKEQNIKLENEIKRRIEESVFEISQRELVLKKIKESDQRFSSIFYFNPDIQIIINANTGKVFDVNEAFANFFNLSVIDVIDIPILDVSFGISKFSLIKLLKVLSQNSNLYNYKIPALSSFENYLWLSLSSVKLTIDNEDCFVIAIKDYTSEAKIVNDFEQIYQKFSLISCLNNDFIWTTNLDFNYEFVSESITRLLGYKPEELLNQPLTRILSFNSSKIFNEKIYQLLRSLSNSRSHNNEFEILESLEFIHKSGVNLIFDFKARFVKNQFNEFVRLEGVCTDITEKHKIEDLNSQKNKFYDTILSSLNDIVFWFNDNQTLTFVTESVFDFIGYTPEDLYKMNIHDVLTQKSIEKTDHLVKFIKGKYDNERRNLTKNLNYELEFISKKGEIKTANVKSRLFYNNQYQFQGFVATVKDISSEKTMNELNRQSEMYFKKLFNESPVMMVIADDAYNILDANFTFLSNFKHVSFDIKQIKWTKILLNTNYSEFKTFDSGLDYFAKLFINEDNILDVLVNKADFTNEDQKRMNLFVLRDVTLQTNAEQERSIRENQFIALSENSPDIIIRFNKSLECIYANYSVFKELKIDTNNLIGKKTKEIFKDEKVANEIYDSCLNSIIEDKEMMIEYRLEIDDKIKYFKNRIIPEYDMFGKVISVLSVATNVSDYVTAIKSLKHNLNENAFLNQVIAICNRASLIDELIQNIFEVFSIHYSKLEFAASIYDNDYKLSRLIFTSLNEELKHQLIRYFSDKENDSKFKTKIKAHSNDNLIFGFEKLEFELYHKKVTLYVLPILSKETLLGYMFINLNNSMEENLLLSSEIVKSLSHEVGSSINRILAEHKQIESSKNYRMLVETTSDLVWKVNDKMEFTFVSSKVNSLLGYSSKELINTSFFNLIDTEKRDQIIQFISLNSSSPEMFTFYDLPIIHKKGEIIYVELIAYPMIDENGVFNGYSGINRDITIRKINDDLRRSKELAEGLTKVKQQFIDNISHEIRTPLNAIIGLTEVLGKYNVTNEQIKYIESIQKNGQSLLGLINDILDVSRIESGKFILNYESISAKDFLSDLYFSFLPLANEKKLVLEFDVDPLLPDFIFIDEIRLTQVFNNLISNAIKFTETGFIKVLVKTLKFPQQKNKTGLIISVIDSGIGISAKDIDFVFDNFIQSSNQNSKKYGGSGLGLGISKKIIETMKGNISVESSTGKGSIFKIILPEVEIGKVSINGIKNDNVNLFNWILIGCLDKNTEDFKIMFGDKCKDILSINSPLQLKDLYIDEPESIMLIVSAKYFFEQSYYSHYEKFNNRIIVIGKQNVSYLNNNLNYVLIENFAKFNIYYALSKIEIMKSQNVMEKSNVTQISSQSIEETFIENHELKEFIINKLDVLWTQIKNTNSINDITNFADIISQFANEKNIKDLISYSNDLQLAIKIFDISEINKLIEMYSDIKIKLIHVS